MWLITKHQMVRTYEKDWALTVDPEHDFTKDIYYYIADPDHNPEADIKWLTPYYDAIWKHWMTSIVAPIYIDSRFLGVVGHDVLLDEVYDKILNQKYFESGFGFIFDHEKNIVVHPKYLDRLRESAEMGAPLSTSDLGDPELSLVLAKIVDNSTPDRRLNFDRFLAEGKIQYLFAYKLDFLDWYFAIVTPQKEILKMLPQYRRYFISAAMVGCLLLLLMVIAVIWLSVIKPINTLKKTANEIRMGDLDKTVDIKSRDEIGELSKAFNEMTGRLKIQMKELKTAEEKYRSIFENAVEGIFQITPDGRIINASPSTASILGYEGPDDLLKCVSNLGTDLYVDPTQWDKLIRMLDVRDTVSHFEARVYKKDGSTLWVSLNTRAARHTGGQLNYLEGFLSDITERKEAEEALSKLNKELDQRVVQRTTELVQAKEAADKAREKAEVANMAKSTFLANMSHELRTPLNAVLGFSRIMENSPDVTKDQVENLKIITRSGEHLLNLINNVLDISKIESGRVELEASHFDLLKLLQDMKSMMTVRANEKGLGLTLEQAPDLPRLIVADAGKLRQVLLNLIGNAVKYTTSGSVIIRAMVAEKESPGPFWLRIEVEDTGHGIPPEARERIFFPFVQMGERPPTDAGAGLGLAICKQYVELMDGVIGVSSKRGKGSVFHFEVPVSVLADESRPVEPQHGRIIGLAEGQPSRRLLIVEDQPDSRLLLSKLLAPLGFDLREAVNGQEAITQFTRWHPHLIFMDMRMPVMDGLTATRRIKATEAGAQTKIVALTAHALEEERREILAAGCDDFIRKPYKDTDIFDALAEHLGVRFIHDEKAPADVVSEGQLSAAALAELPPELLEGLEKALIRLDIGAVDRAIEAIRVHEPSMVEILAAKAKELQFGQILRVIESIHAETDRKNTT
jgi:PAS domain S-box-containing protein